MLPIPSNYKILSISIFVVLTAVAKDDTKYRFGDAHFRTEGECRIHSSGRPCEWTGTKRNILILPETKSNAKPMGVIRTCPINRWKDCFVGTDYCFQQSSGDTPIVRCSPSKEICQRLSRNCFPVGTRKKLRLPEVSVVPRGLTIHRVCTEGRWSECFSQMKAYCYSDMLTQTTICATDHEQCSEIREDIYTTRIRNLDQLLASQDSEYRHQLEQVKSDLNVQRTLAQRGANPDEAFQGKEGRTRLAISVLAAIATSFESRSQSSCCKVCFVGKPCGNTCINVNDTCHQLSGCACPCANEGISLMLSEMNKARDQYALRRFREYQMQNELTRNSLMLLDLLARERVHEIKNLRQLISKQKIEFQKSQCVEIFH